MKFRVTLKTPDVLYDAILEALGEDQDGIELKHETAWAVAQIWFKYEEYLTVEIDTEAKTATVIPVKEL